MASYQSRPVSRMLIITFVYINPSDGDGLASGLRTSRVQGHFHPYPFAAEVGELGSAGLLAQVVAKRLAREVIVALPTEATLWSFDVAQHLGIFVRHPYAAAPVLEQAVGAQL